MSALESAPVEAASSTFASASAHSLYERHAPSVVRYCRRLLDSREDAEDAAQTTFAQAFAALGRGVVPEVDRAWLLAIARNVCHDHWRRTYRRRTVETERDPEILAEVFTSEDPDRDDLIPLRSALQELTDQQRRAILLREWQGLAYHEIAADLGISQSAVETLIFRARRALARGLDGERRAAHWGLFGAFDLGSIGGALKGLFGGGVAKAAFAVAIVGSIAAVGPVGEAVESPRSSRTAEAVRVMPAVRAQTSAAVSVEIRPRHLPQRASGNAPTQARHPKEQQVTRDEPGSARIEGTQHAVASLGEDVGATLGATAAAASDPVDDVAGELDDAVTPVVPESLPNVGVDVAVP